MFDVQLFGSVVVGACSDQEEMQQMERLLFEEFRGQQELDSGRRNRLDGVGNQLLERRSTEAAPELGGRSTTKKSCNEQKTGLNHVVNPAD
jgi:hypothetical protein